MTFATDLALAGLVSLFGAKGQRPPDAAPDSGALKGLPFALAADPQERSNDNQRTGIGRYDFRLRAGEVATIALVGDWLHLDANYSCGSLRVQLDPSGSMSSLASVILRPGQSIKGPFSGVSIAPVGDAAGRLLLGSGLTLLGESHRASFIVPDDPLGGASNVEVGTVFTSTNAPPALNNFLVAAGSLAFGWKNLIISLSGYGATEWPTVQISSQFAVQFDGDAGCTLLSGDLIARKRFIDSSGNYWMHDTFQFDDGCVRSDALVSGGVGRIFLAVNTAGPAIVSPNLHAQFDLYQFK